MRTDRLKDLGARLGLATALGLTLGAGAAQAQEAVTFGTNWLAQAEHGGYYQAVADGTYKACGLDVTIVPGGPQVNNRALMLAGKIDFHMGGNMLQAFYALREGIPVTVVAADFQKEPQVIITHPGKYDSFQAMAGDAPLLIGDNGFASFYQWMISEFGFTVEQRKPYTFNPAPFLADPAAGQQGYVTSEPYAVEREGGFEPDIYLLADEGFSTYATTIETMADTVANRPEAVKCFVEGSAIGWYNFLYGDNSAATKAIMSANPEMTTEQIAFSIEKMKEYGIVDSGDTETMGIGAMTDARMDDFYAKMVKAGVVEDGLDIKQSYTLDFVNKGVGLDIKKKLTGQ
ncbi:MAG: nitrate ABC transporter substrate-binding protein [Stappia sp.]|uniref:ABC transporter substrate-binding protein n=1 Tax=Stappia sp. TaxID=1870903 RepID=UPI000C619EF4|nr:ABC transporter substrate-binding protein [Stappia sp.]MAA98915.1 nitrate ABC transporter substrate-binding protein [Stappia sp.]MBM21540.1 nitrate ABC transporter substrate-binding protein [Stappia sp.]